MNVAQPNVRPLLTHYLLACLAYSPREYELIRLGCDLMSIFYVFDEYSDVTDGPGAEEIRTIIMDALRNPDKRRPDDEVMLGRMCQDWWRRANKQVNPNSTCLKHFIHDFDLYTAAVVTEAEDRNHRVYRTFEEYLAIRRDSSGCYPSFVIHEFGLDLPEEIYLHPRLKRLREQATDLIALGNDINSYAIEKSRGLELHNGVELVMKE
ncbi:hypothetical protein E2P81_ATG04343 [Venturia nashicola]|nr:hypothetical protein E2P81_ATG04343 [Venturia nashicola]